MHALPTARTAYLQIDCTKAQKNADLS